MTYDESPPFLTQSPFAKDDPEDGNAPFQDIRMYTEGSLVEFGKAFPNLGPLTPTLSTLSDTELEQAHNDLGDGATMGIIALDTLLRDQGPVEDAALVRRSCHLGVWFGWVIDQNSESLALSPGDVGIVPKQNRPRSDVFLIKP
jgi:hypothetical protein